MEIKLFSEVLFLCPGLWFAHFLLLTQGSVQPPALGQREAKTSRWLSRNTQVGVGLGGRNTMEVHPWRQGAGTGLEIKGSWPIEFTWLFPFWSAVLSSFTIVALNFFPQVPLSPTPSLSALSLVIAGAVYTSTLLHRLSARITLQELLVCLLMWWEQQACLLGTEESWRHQLWLYFAKLSSKG